MDGSIHLFKITGKLSPENVRLRTNIFRDIPEVEWKEVCMTLNNTRIKLQTSVIKPLKDNFKIRRMRKRDSLIFHITLKQGITWFPLLSKVDEEPV